MADIASPFLCNVNNLCCLVEELAQKSTPQGLKRVVEGKPHFIERSRTFPQMLVGLFDCLSILLEDIGEMILQLRKQVESLFSTKYGEEP